MFSHKVMTTMAALVWTLAFSSLGFARGGHGPGHGPGDLFMGAPPDLATVDSNGDGEVSKEEIKAARAAEFKTIDTDGDGSVGLLDVQTWAAYKVVAHFKSLDKDGNGLVSSDEFANGKTGRGATMAKNLLKLGDTDGDGSLSADEFTKMASTAEKSAFHFAAMDADGDGKVSEAEFSAPPPRMHHAGAPGAAGPASE